MSTFVTDPISPELVLVDPELAQALRATAQEPLLRPPAAAAPEPEPLAAEPAPVAAPRWLPSRRQLGIAGGALTTLAVLVAMNHQVARPRAQTVPVPAAVAEVVEPTPAAPAPAAAPTSAPAKAETPPPSARTYYWPGQQGVDAYAVAFRKGPLTVYATQTTTPYVVLPAGFHFQPGSYTWTVSPVTVSKGTETVGPPLLESSFVISSR